MNFIESRAVFVICLICVLGVVKDVLSEKWSNSLCGLRTDELIRYYGYEAEVHTVTTEDGYVLTIFRCNSAQSSNTKKKPVLVTHGLLISSDDFCLNAPNQSLAYILADAGYDVWLQNSRGNFYSRKHLSKDPNNPYSGFWEFSWYEMGIYDQPAVIDYILEQTAVPKLYYIGYSQGTTSIMVLLSEKPEYNDKILVASLLAPVGYMRHSNSVFQFPPKLTPIMDRMGGWELLPRNGLVTTLKDTLCARNLTACNEALDSLFGPSENQRNNKILPAFMCHFPSGSSFKQYNHFVQETSHGFFGKYMKGSRIPRNFRLSRITTPISLHYTSSDRLSNYTDVEILIPKLKNAVFVQRIDSPKMNHVDILWGEQSAALIFSNILNIFQMYQ